MASAAADEERNLVEVVLTINGDERTMRIPVSRRLVSVLRDDLDLTGTKLGCEVGICGVCTVLVDGRPTSSCLTLAVQANGADIRTIEGLGDDERFAQLQRGFLEEGGSQCGFCTSGQLVALAAMQLEGRLAEASKDEVIEQLHGNICRCTGYYGILRAADRCGS